MRYTESARKGQKVRCETSPDRSSHKLDAKKSLMGKDMKNVGLSHSISGKNTSGYQ